MLHWREDGTDRWLAAIDGGRDARVQKVEGRYLARRVGGADPCHMGSFDSLGEAQQAFAPAGEHRGAVEDAAAPKAVEQPGPAAAEPAGGPIIDPTLGASTQPAAST